MGRTETENELMMSAELYDWRVFWLDLINISLFIDHISWYVTVLFALWLKGPVKKNQKTLLRTSNNSEPVIMVDQ